jgi:hypothetical protein
MGIGIGVVVVRQNDQGGSGVARDRVCVYWCFFLCECGCGCVSLKVGTKSVESRDRGGGRGRCITGGGSVSGGVQVGEPRYTRVRMCMQEKQRFPQAYKDALTQGISGAAFAFV